jgi:hypothetical protein
MLTKDANAGDPVAQHELGIRYLLGDGFECDSIQAVKWIGKSAEKKFTPALYNYAIVLLNGIGGNWDPFKAFSLMQEAAVNGMKEAQYAYGLFFTDNLTVAKNLNVAYYWLKKSSENGFTPASDVINELIRSGFIIPDKSEEPIANYFEKSDTSITNYQPIIMPSSSLVYLDLSISQDSVRKVGNDDVLIQFLKQSKLNLDTSNSNTKFDQFDFEKYIDSIKLSGEYGSPECLTLIGLLYQTGTYYQKDLIKAAKHYMMAIRLESPFAYVLLLQLVRLNNFNKILKDEVNQNNFDANYVWAGIHALDFQSNITDKDALNLLISASKNSHVPSMIELGFSYINGKLDREAGIRLWKRASDLNSNEAKIRLLFLDALQLTNFDSIVESIEYLINVEDKGSLLAQIVLGYYYEMGFGFLQNDGRAAQYYRKAASRGSKIALNALTRLYDKKRSVEKVLFKN